MKILDIPQSGSIGNQTSSRNRSGQYRRQRVLPTQPRTVAQVLARSRLTIVSAGWRGLTVAQRAAWAAFSNSFTVVNSLGSTISLTGAQCFVKVNTVNLVNGDAIVSVPPALPAFLALLVTSATATAGTPAVYATGTSPAAGTKYMFYASPQVSPGVSYCPTYRYLLTLTTATATKFDCTAAYTAKFGAPIAGKQIFLKVVQSQAGMQDNGTNFAVIVGA